jgi:hypothetical protein
LYALEDGRDVNVDASSAGGAETGIQLVDLAVRIDSGIGLGHTRLVEQRRFPGVSGFRVDLHP